MLITHPDAVEYSYRRAMARELSHLASRQPLPMAADSRRVAQHHFDRASHLATASEDPAARRQIDALLATFAAHPALACATQARTLAAGGV